MEKRKNKRVDMITDVELSRLGEEGTTADRYVNANIFNISRGGIGFETMYPLEIGSYYDTRITLWSREVVSAVLEIIHGEELERGYRYGGEFIGISDSDALKIDIYQVFNDI